MPAKPSYIGLLNAIAVAETAAGPAFDAWADATSDKRLEKTLRLVGLREAEHGLAFRKRMAELGYDVREPEMDPGAELNKVATSTRSDVSKLRGLKFNREPSGPDIFERMFADKTIDPVTGGLLGRYIAEERDTGRLLKAEFDRLATREQAAKQRAAAKPAKAAPTPKAKAKKTAKA